MFRKKTANKKNRRQLRRWVSADELNRMIQERAYSYYEQRGYQTGNDLEDWLRAESEVKREFAID